MGRPLRAKYSGAVAVGLQEMSDAELQDLVIPLIINTVLANNTLIENTGNWIRFDQYPSVANYVSRGAALDGYTAGVGVHPASVSYDTHTLYQTYSTQTMTTQARPVHYVLSGGEYQVREMSNDDMNSFFWPYIVSASSMLTGGRGSYYLLAPSDSLPAGTWTDRNNYFFQQHYDSAGTNILEVYRLYQRTDAWTANNASTNLPLKLVNNQLTEMTQADITALAPFLGEYYRTTGVGTYNVGTAAPGTGTWVGRGAYIDKINDLSGISYSGTYQQSFTGAFSGTYIGNYATAYTGQYSGGFTGAFSGIYQSILNYSGNYVGAYIGYYAGSYSGTYGQSFTGGYVTGYAGNYTGAFTGAYGNIFTGVYTGAFTGAYNTTYAGTYTGAFSGTYIGNYTGAFTGQYSGVYTRISQGPTRIQAFSRQYYTDYLNIGWSWYDNSYVGYYTDNYLNGYYNGHPHYFTGVYVGNYSASTPNIYAGVFVGGYAHYYVGGGGTGIGYFSGAYVSGFASFVGAFTTTYVGNYTGLYSGSYAQTFTHINVTLRSVNFTGAYTAAYTGAYSRAFTGQYSGGFTGVYSRVFSGIYNTTYTGIYTGAFTGLYTGAYSGFYSGAYTGVYSTIGYFSGTYSRVFTGAFTGSYISFYTGAYTGAFSKVFTGAFTGAYTGLTVLNTTTPTTYTLYVRTA